MKKIIQIIFLISLLPVALYSQNTICRNAYLCNKKNIGITYVSYLTVNSTYKQQIDSIVGNKIYISGNITVADYYPWLSKEFSEPLGNLSDGEYVLQHSIVVAKNKLGDTTNTYYETDTIYTTTFNVFNGKYIGEDGFYTDGMTWITGYFKFDAKDVVAEVYPRYHTYVINGDTVIGDNRYKKMDEYSRSIYSADGYWRTFFTRYENGKYMFYFPDDFYRDDYKYLYYWIGDDVVFFDENLKSGDSNAPNEYEKIAYVGDTLFDDSPDEVRRYWKLSAYSNSRTRYTDAMNNVLWIEGIGSISQPIPYFINEVDCACYEMLMYCINSEGDTIYRNKKYIDLVAPYFKTNMKPLTAGDISITQANGECIVTLPTATKWSAVLYNSNGIAVAGKAGEGCEIILPDESKGTHILVMNIDGKEYTKKVVIR